MLIKKTSELTGPALDWAVAKCEGGTDFRYDTMATYWITIGGKDRALSKGWAQSFTPSTDWAQGGPIIEREKIEIIYYGTKGFYGPWEADIGCDFNYISQQSGDGIGGQTPLIAAMRCYVASKLGEEVEVPKELV